MLFPACLSLLLTLLLGAAVPGNALPLSGASNAASPLKVSHTVVQQQPQQQLQRQLTFAAPSLEDTRPYSPPLAILEEEESMTASPARISDIEIRLVDCPAHHINRSSPSSTLESYWQTARRYLPGLQLFSRHVTIHAQVSRDEKGRDVVSIAYCRD